MDNPEVVKLLDQIKVLVGEDPHDRAWTIRMLAEKLVDCRETPRLVYETLGPWLESQ